MTLGAAGTYTTVVLFPPRDPGNPADFRVTLEAGEFDADVLVRMGR